MTEAVCVFCRQHPVDPAWRPFCSERCKLQDLARWADGAYRIAREDTDDAAQTQNSKVETENPN